MKKFCALILLAAVVLSLTSCSSKKDTDNSVYDSFISGKVTAAGADNKKIKISDLSSDKTAKCALLDLNGDNINELLIKSNESLKIFTVKNGSVYLIIELPTYYNPLNNGAFLYKRVGSAPEHTDYIYTIINTNGEKLFEQSFSEYKISETESKYFINDKEISKEAYESVSDPILEIKDDKISFKILNPDNKKS